MSFYTIITTISNYPLVITHHSNFMAQFDVWNLFKLIYTSYQTIDYTNLLFNTKSYVDHHVDSCMHRLCCLGDVSKGRLICVLGSLALESGGWDRPSVSLRGSSPQAFTCFGRIKFIDWFLRHHLGECRRALPAILKGHMSNFVLARRQINISIYHLTLAWVNQNICLC